MVIKKCSYEEFENNLNVSTSIAAGKRLSENVQCLSISLQLLL